MLRVCGLNVGSLVCVLGSALQAVRYALDVGFSIVMLDSSSGLGCQFKYRVRIVGYWFYTMGYWSQFLVNVWIMDSKFCVHWMLQKIFQKLNFTFKKSGFRLTNCNKAEEEAKGTIHGLAAVTVFPNAFLYLSTSAISHILSSPFVIALTCGKKGPFRVYILFSPQKRTKTKRERTSRRPDKRQRARVPKRA